MFLLKKKITLFSNKLYITISIRGWERVKPRSKKQSFREKQRQISQMEGKYYTEIVSISTI